MTMNNQQPTTMTKETNKKEYKSRVERHIYRRGDRYEVEIKRKGLPKPYWGSFRKLSSARVQRDAVLARAYAEGLISKPKLVITPLAPRPRTKPRVERHIYRRGNQYRVEIKRKGLPKPYWGSFPDLASARAKRDEVLALPEAGGRVSIPVTDNPRIVSSMRAPRSTSTSDGSTRRVDRNIYYRNKRYRVEIYRNGLDSFWGSFPDIASARVRRDEVLARAEGRAYQVPDYNDIFTNNNN